MSFCISLIWAEIKCALTAYENYVLSTNIPPSPNVRVVVWKVLVMTEKYSSPVISAETFGYLETYYTSGYCMECCTGAWVAHHQSSRCFTPWMRSKAFLEGRSAPLYCRINSRSYKVKDSKKSGSLIFPGAS